MSQTCPSCSTPVKPDARFCIKCGAGLVPQPDVSPVIVAVETNRPHVTNVGSLLRFNVTNMCETPCDVSIRTVLYGRGGSMEQRETDLRRKCQFKRREEQLTFSFPFCGREARLFLVEELRITVVREDRPDRVLVYELPDQSLHVQVADPERAVHGASGNVISPEIRLDLPQLKEMYGADIKIGDVNINMDVSQKPDQQQPEEWQPIRLRFVEEAALEPEEVLPPELRITVPGGVALDLVRIRAGRFVMGSPEDQGKDNERPAHRVSISRDFYFGKFLITQEQYQALVGQNPSKFPLSPRHPVDNVSWNDAKEFCRRLQAHLAQLPDALGDDLVTIDTVGLPTEVQWEYACRAGTQTLYWFGDDRKQLPDYGWFDKNSDRTTHPVGQLKPNAWGLYDTHGNLWEWCEDFYAEDYHTAANEDPKGPEAGDRRVLRGGSWSYYAKDCRSARRHAAAPSERTANYGFRVVLRVTSTP